MKKGLLFLILGVLLISLGSGQQAEVCEGEAAALFTASSKIWPDSALPRDLFTDSELPILLGDSSFSGNVVSKYEQRIQFSDNVIVQGQARIIGGPKLIYAKQPSSGDDPNFGLSFGTTSDELFYKADVLFSINVNFNHINSKGKNIILFGNRYTVLDETNNNQLVLKGGSFLVEKISLSSNGETSKVVVVDGKRYLIKLVSATDESATIKVIDLVTLQSENKEIAENKAKIIQGVKISVLAADSTNFVVSADIEVLGPDKVKLMDGNSVKIGDSEDSVDGTLVRLGGTVDSLWGIEILVFAPDTDSDAIIPSYSEIHHQRTFLDPIFRTFKVDSGDFNIGEDDSNNRDFIYIKDAGGLNIMTLTMTEHRGNEKTIRWVFAENGKMRLSDSGGDEIHVFEREKIFKREYVVVGNEDYGGLWELREVSGDTSAPINSRVEFEDVFTGNTVQATITDANWIGDNGANAVRGVGTITLLNKVYSIEFYDDKNMVDEEYVRLKSKDGGILNSNSPVIYPTIETEKGAKVSFYEPLIISKFDWDGLGNQLNGLRIPNGDGYLDVDIPDGRFLTLKGNYQIESEGIDHVKVRLVGSVGASIAEIIEDPALVIFEEKDDLGVINSLIVRLEGDGTDTNGLGVSDVIRTWSEDERWDSLQLVSDPSLYKEADRYGTIVTVNQEDSDQHTALINYPDEQMYANSYITSEICELPGPPPQPNPVPEPKPISSLPGLVLSDDEAAYYMESRDGITYDSETLGKSYFHGITVSDVSGDGIEDIIAAGLNKIRVFYGLDIVNGKRIFEEKQFTVDSLTGGTIRYHDVISGNFDERNNFNDIALVDDGSEVGVQILLSQENKDMREGNFYSLPLSGGTRRIRSADLNNDGHLDLVVPGSNGNRIFVLKGDGRGNFNVENIDISWPGPLNVQLGGTNALDVGDIDNDGDIDIIQLDFSGGIIILANDGRGGFDFIDDFGNQRNIKNDFYTDLGWGNEIKLHDYNSDGNLDFVYMNGGALIAFRGEGDSNFQLDQSVQAPGTWGRWGSSESIKIIKNKNGNDLISVSSLDESSTGILLFEIQSSGKITFRGESVVSNHLGRVIHDVYYDNVKGFVRGDFDENGVIDITDGISILNYLFLNGAEPSCVKAADVNDDGSVDVTDGVYLLNYLFQGGPAPPAPFENMVAGIDPTSDDLDCSG
jgi:hypothetical protein